ncbi:abnormal spindle-like microcephaly-associated protein homolog [Octopus bimaculoides]|nr:abnormal spindle-like microcephaly-associated protein homolog [Octopus bimaculoides]
MSSVKTPFSVLHTPNLTNLKSYNSTEIQYKTVSSKRTQNKTISNRENTVPPSTKMVAKNRISPNQCTVKNYSSKKNDSVSCMNVNTNLELQTEYSVQEISSISKNVICVPYEDSPENKTIEIDNEVAVLTCVRNVTVESAESANEYQHSYVTTKRQKQMADEVIGPSFCKQSPRRETYLVKKQKRRSWKNKLKKSPTSSGSLPVVTSFSPPQLSPPHVYDNSIKNTTLSINSVSPIQTNFLLTSSPIESHHQTSACPNRSNLLLPNECSGNGFQDVCQREDREDNAKLEVLSQLGHPSELTRIEKQASPKSDNGLSSDSLNSRYSSPNSEIIYDLHQTPMLSAQDTSISRRSTHVIKEPKILCKAGALKKKSLFCCEKKPFPVGKIPVNCKVIRANTTPKNDRISSYKVRTAKRVTQSTEKAPCEKEKTEMKRRPALSPKKPAVAQSRLILGKREKTVIPKHPMPFASKNIYYDERWMQKQEWSFTHWFNYILTPVEEYKIRKCVKVDAKSLLFSTKQEARLAPSKEVLSFEAYAARKRLNRLRKLSCKMFQTEDVVKVVQRLEVEIDSQRLVMRKDRPVHADIGLKQMILNWILSYNSLWLRIGLEMVFGEILLIDSNTDFLGLSRFIVTRLLGNPDIANRYAHPTVPHLYREGYQEALSKHTLKKYLILVFFLDYAKRKRLIEHDPCLFCKDAEIKASKNLLYNIAREFLKGEGDVTRHLSYFGYTVSYVQTPLHEFDYAVSNLAVDLRDGIRLTRAVEILTGKWELTNSLRAPAISHLQKIHNVNKVLKALLVNGMDLSLAKGSICAKDIVDGHREKTLTLLWRIVTGFQVDILLDINELRDEVHFLKRCLEKKRSVRKLAGVEDYSIGRNSVEGLVKPENEKHQLLFEWCQAVSAHYGLQIENFTVSFSDGRVLCYLIHHYYPGLLPLSEIKQDTTVTYINECENQQQDSDQSLDELAFSTLFSPKTGKPKIYEALLANEAENFKLIAKKVSAIGGVPAMLRHSDMSNTIPDEKVVITYITYLAIRLLEIRHEARAAIVIQMAWRKYLWCKKQRLRRMKSKSAVVTQWQCNTMNKIQILSPQVGSYDKTSPLVKHSNKNLALSPSQCYQKHNNTEHSYLPKCNLGTIAEVSCLDLVAEGNNWQRGAETNYNSPLNLVIRKVNDSNDLGQQKQENLNAREECISIKTSKLNQTIEFEHEDFNNHLNGTFEINNKPHHSRLLNQTIDIDNGVQGNICSVEKSGDEIVTEYIGMPATSKQHSVCSPNKYLEHNQNLNDGTSDRNMDLNDKDNINESEANSTTEIRSRLETSTLNGSTDGDHGLQNDSTDGDRALQNGSTDDHRVLLQNGSTDDHHVLPQNGSTDDHHVLPQNGSTDDHHVLPQNTDDHRVLPQNGSTDDHRVLPQNDSTDVHHVLPQNDSTDGDHGLPNGSTDGHPDLLDVSTDGHHDLSADSPADGHCHLQDEFPHDQDCSTVSNCDDQKGSSASSTANIITDVNNSGLVDYERLSSSKYDSKHLSQVECDESDSADGIQVLNSSKINTGLQPQSDIVFEDKSLILQDQIDAGDSRPNILDVSRGVLEQQCAIVIQRWYRNLQESYHVASDYQRMKSAVIVLQSFYRMYSQQRKYHKQLKAIRVLQAAVRMHQTRQNYRSLCRSTTQIQQWYRGIILCRKQRNKYLKEKQACIQIQSMWRGVMQRQLLKSQEAAAVVIQSYFRKHYCQSKYLKLLSSVILIQKLYRSKLESRKLRRQFLQELREKQLQEEKRQNNAAQLIQATWKCYVAQREFSKLKAATCVLQRYMSAYLIGKHVRHDFIAQKNAAVKIQSNLRGFIARRRYHNIVVSVTLIQALFRGSQVRKEFHLKCHSAVIIQCHWRAYLAKTKFQAEKRTIIRMQALVRAKQQQEKYLNCKNAAIVIQQWYRSISQMRQCHKDYLELKKYTKILQARFRALRSMKICRQQFLQKRIAITTIQAHVRQFLTRQKFCKQKESVILLQNWFRACKVAKSDRAYYLSLKTYTIKMQSHVRSWQQQRKYLELKDSALKIQNWYRAVILMRSDQQRYMEYRTAVVKIQSVYRCYREQQKFNKQKRCAVKLQEWWRATSSMRAERKSYLSKQAASQVIQQWFRSLIAMKLAREDYLKVRASVITIQSYLRKTIQERHFKRTKSSVIKIQQWYRACIQMEIERKNYCSLKTSTVFLQSVVQMKLQHKCFLTQRSSAIKIQRWYRILKSRRQLKETIARRHVAATCIQNWFKRAVAAKKARSIFNLNCDCCTAASLLLVKVSAEYWLLKTRTKKLNAVCTVQKYCRRWLHHRHQAATVIQSFVRGWLFRKCLAKQTAAAIVIQSNIRAFYARKLFEKKKSAILTIARYLQQYLKRRDHAAQLIQRVMRGWIVRKRVKKFHRNATLIQSYWRGYKVRCQSKRTITKLRQRLVAVTKEATEDKKLISRFAKGFDQLMKFKHLSDVLHALVNLEAASRLSPVCCLQLARENAIPVIYNIIKGCNRSVPHMELIKYSIQIFLNLAKYAPTIESVYHSRPDAIDIILNVMMVFREKGLVFSKSCILLGSIALDLKEKGKMDELLSRQKFVEKIMSLHKLTVWKYKQEEIRIVTRARLVAAKDACPFYENTVLSKIGPDWLLSKKKLQEFEEPLKAMTYLIYCLGLQDKLPKQLSKNLKM